MGDKAIRGNKLTRRSLDPSAGRKKPIETFEQEVNASPLEALGIRVSGGIEGKPHSTTKGRKMAGARELTRSWYGRGKKYTDFKKKQKEQKKGVSV